MANMNNKCKIIFLGGRELGVNTLEWLCGCEWAEIVGVCPLPQDFDPNYYEAMSAIIDKYNLRVYDIENIKHETFDIGLSVNYHKLIKEDVLSVPSNGFYNVHHSYNLRLRGRNITTQAILKARPTGFNYHGTTLHKIVPALDCGPIVASYSCEIEPNDTAYTLFKKVDTLAFDMIKTWMPRVASNSVVLYETPSEGYFTFRNKDLPSKQIVLDSMTEEDVYDYVRAFDFPGYDPAYVQVGAEVKPLVISKRDSYSNKIKIMNREYYTL